MIFLWIILVISSHLKYFFPLQIIAFDELKTDYKNPIDQCNSLNPLVLPEYILHIFFNVLFLVAGEFFSLFLNVPLIGYHVSEINRLNVYRLFFKHFQFSGSPIYPSSCHEWSWIVWSYKHYERWYFKQMPKRRLDQTGILLIVVFLLSLRVSKYFVIFMNNL